MTHAPSLAEQIARVERKLALRRERTRRPGLAGEPRHENGRAAGPHLNVVVGIIGALVAGFVVAPFLGTGTIDSNDFSLAGLLVSFAGAVILLAIVNLFRRGRVR